MKTGIVLFNLGGPSSLDSVRPFLRNLFSDPAIIRLPSFLRLPIAWAASKRRAPSTKAIYRALGGASPLLPNTKRQAALLETKMKERGYDAQSVIAMRYWHPFAEEALEALRSWGAERLLLLPLYPHYSTTTTQSSFQNWQEACRKANFHRPTERICCYPELEGFVTAHAQKLGAALREFADEPPRVLFSAHGLPERIVQSGDPYPRQIEASAKAIAAAARLSSLGVEWRVSYQSRVGPLKWIEPYTEEEIRKAGVDKKPLLILPISFVSDHSETLVELDQEYRDLALQSGVPHYVRVPVLGDDDVFMDALADAAQKSLEGENKQPFRSCGRVCGWGEKETG